MLVTLQLLGHPEPLVPMPPSSCRQEKLAPLTSHYLVSLKATGSRPGVSGRHWAGPGSQSQERRKRPFSSFLSGLVKEGGACGCLGAEAWFQGGGFQVGTERAGSSGHLHLDEEPQALIQVQPGHRRSLPLLCCVTWTGPHASVCCRRHRDP